MGKNRGKQFEDVIKKSFEKVDNCYIQRLYDPGFGYSGIRNFSDFFVFYQGNLIFIECKSVEGNTLNFSRITENQFDGLKSVSKRKNIAAGILVWFKDKDFTCFIPIKELIKAKEIGLKSISFSSIDNLYHILLNGEKKRILFDYDALSFLDVLIDYIKEEQKQ